MLKRFMTIFGIGLILFWVAGLNSTDNPSWVSWCLGIAAMCSLGVAAFMPTFATRNTRMGVSVLFAVGLYLLWVSEMSRAVVPWVGWWTFTFACAFLLLGIIVGLTPERQAPTSEVSTHGRVVHEKDRFRRGA